MRARRMMTMDAILLVVNALAAIGAVVAVAMLLLVWAALAVNKEEDE